MEEFLNYHIGSLTVERLLVALLVALVGIALVKLILRTEKKIFEKTDWDQSLKNMIVIISRLLLDAVVGVVTLDYLGIPMTSVVTVLGIVGLAVSLAIQDTLANVFAGLLLLTAKVFASGDYVQLDGVEGTVIKVDLMNTHLRTADNKTVRIPNNNVQTAPIVNFSREALRRVELRVDVSYDDDTDKVKASLLRSVTGIAAILDDPAPFAGLLSFKASSIEYVVRGWARSEEYWDAYFALTETVRRNFAEDGIKMTYDHLNVHLVKEETP